MIIARKGLDDWWGITMGNLTTYMIGVGLSIIIFTINNWIGVSEIEKALFTRIEKIKHFLSELLIGGIITFTLFIIYFTLIDDTVDFTLLFPVTLFFR